MSGRFQIGDLVALKQITLPDVDTIHCRVGTVTNYDKKIGRRTKKYLIHWVPANKLTWHYPSELFILNRKEGNV